jgi:hypothetical protein
MLTVFLEKKGYTIRALVLRNKRRSKKRINELRIAKIGFWTHTSLTSMMYRSDRFGQNRNTAE